ncbi:SPOSA6832_02975 [Sporobolomyces salmonicolor]|uniref:Translation initiation factor IF-2, mitochondrial n=1 Tax=Sporidiobolus salmonicolor TaxID=5005 RepID=A0A0D6EMT4_SPOSA|nr:SPOSA6832_02975 [Sporobolomyces salmonicolor]
MIPGQVNRSSRGEPVGQLVGRAAAPRPAQQQQRRAMKKPKVLKKVALPSTLRLDSLVNILKMKLWHVQKAAERLGFDDVRPERLLTAEDASIVALELGFEPTVDDEAAFDLYPAPPSPPSLLSPRPPVTGIFGHVDHGKTSLLDALRATSVAAGEAGGITQHIGAFEVEVDTMVANLRAREKGEKAPPAVPAVKKGSERGPTITFLDTPGHAAFTAMRSRGADVTDVVVLVVAADDGVKPQTEEVIGLIKSADVGVVVALTKVDKPGVDTLKVKQGLMAAGVEIEDFGGDIPCVEVSSVTGHGLPELLETISAIAEVRELQAENEGPAEGRVIESRVEKGRGNVATVLVLRGCLRTSASLIAGTTWARVRTLLPPSGKPLTSALPGQPVEVTGWKELPSAGDLVLEARSEDDAKRAVSNRLRALEQEKLWRDVEVINEKQRRDAEIMAIRREEEEKAKAKGLRGNAVLHAGDAAVGELTGDGKDGIKELLLVIKADVSGTVEAVVGALEGIGNKQAKVKILSSAVGDVHQGDVDMARAVGATIIGFNVKAPNSIAKDAGRGPTPVPIHTSPIIYRLVEIVRRETAALLPKLIDTRVHGEATVQMVFEISVKGKKEGKKIAGSKVSNGLFQKARKARVMRNGEVLHVGTVSTLKRVKTDVPEVTKGTECGIALDDFDAFEPLDVIQSIEEIERSAEL